MNTPPDRSERIFKQLVKASQVPGRMPVIHPEHHVVGEGAWVNGHELVPVGPDVLVFARADKPEER